MAEQSLPQVVATGDRKKSLEAIRDHLALNLADAEGREIASIAKELRAVMAELYSLPGEREGSKSDDLAARRAARRAKASGS